MLEAALRASTEVIHARRYPHTASCTVADEGARAIVLAEEALRDGREGPGAGCHCFGPKARRAPPKTSLRLISSAAGSTARRRRCPGTPSSSAATPSTPASCLLQRLAATRRAHPMTLGTLHDAPSPPPLTSSSSSWRVGGTAGRGPRARWARARSPLAPSPSSRRPRGRAPLQGSGPGGNPGLTRCRGEDACAAACVGAPVGLQNNRSLAACLDSRRRQAGREAHVRPSSLRGRCVVHR